MNASSERCRIGPSPTATITDKENAPVTLPTTVAIAVARPQAIARASTKRTEGPGAKTIITAAMQYSQIREGTTTKEFIRGAYRIKRKRPRSLSSSGPFLTER